RRQSRLPAAAVRPARHPPLSPLLRSAWRRSIARLARYAGGLAGARRGSGRAACTARTRPADPVRLLLGRSARRALLPRAPAAGRATRARLARLAQRRVSPPIRGRVRAPHGGPGDQARARRPAVERAARARCHGLPAARVRAVRSGLLSRLPRREESYAISCDRPH